MNKNLQPIVSMLLHLLPCVPVFFGQYFIAAAVACFVALAYIKPKKLRLRLQDLPPESEEYEQILLTAKRWEYFQLAFFRRWT